MYTSSLIGWICFGFTAILLSKMIFNRKRNSGASVLLRKYHVPMVLATILAMAAHATLSAANAGLSRDALTGMMPVAIAVLLCSSYGMMRKRGMDWMPVHRAMSFLLLITVAAHILISMHAA